MNKEEYIADFLNEIEKIAEKYGWNIGGYDYTKEDWFDLFFVPAIGSDAKNKKF